MKRTGIIGHLFTVMIASCGTVLTASAAIDIAQQPLETGTTVEPNILFMLDDSGSMRFGFMPDSLDSGFNVTRVQNRQLVRTDSCDPEITYAGAFVNPCTVSGRRYLASSHLNTMYFNPNTTYQIPLQPDGITPYPTPSFTSAPHNGYDLSSDRVDLSRNYLALIADFFYSTNAQRRGFAISRFDNQTTQSAAFYFGFNNGIGCQSNPRLDSCYSIVDMANVTAGKKEQFAIWFSFYRTRLMVAKAGVTAAFLQQESGYRLGYGAINLTPRVQSSVARISKTDQNSQRRNFLTWLQQRTAWGGTPLLEALDAAGSYYETEDQPWRADTGDTLLECRQSYTILMTDGYYNDPTISVGEQDDTAGTTIYGPESESGPQKSYIYQPKSPFNSNFSNTLADVAMKYWKRDLRPDLPNTVPTADSSFNPAFWQHMVTFGVGLGVTGNVNAAGAFAAITNNASILWPDPKTNEGKIDDLLHAAVNSRGGFFSASDTTSFVNGLASTLRSITGRVASASNVAATSLNALQTSSNLYQARFTAGNWAGDLIAYDVKNLSLPLWKASEQMPLPADRAIFVGDPDASTLSVRPFLWANLTSNERLALGQQSSIVDYLRGAKDLEKPAGNYRARLSVIGDLVNSSPELVAAPLDLNYQRFSWDGANSYRSFITGSAKSRQPMLYVGGNDGMLHGFSAQTGQELFAYIPRAVMAPLPGGQLNVLAKYADPNYVHQFSVDGSPVVADVYIQRSSETQPKWRSVLISGLGRGGAGMFAIDVSDPTRLNAQSVLWDKNNTADHALMGAYIGKPLIVRLNNGKWAALVGYGYNNSSHASGLLAFDVATGATIANLKTPAGSANQPNGMSELNTIDMNSDGNIDYVYGGDLLGNVWKFDLSASDSKLWHISYNGKPLFSAKDPQGQPQMITGGVLVTQEPKTGKVWVFFGTGRYLTRDDPANSQPQTWYGLMDETPITGRSELTPRLIQQIDSLRVISQAAGLDKEKKGWFIDLPDSRERIVDMPMMVGHELLMNTMIPDTNVCNPSGSGYVMAVEPYTGGGLKYPYFDRNADGRFDNKDSVTIDGKTYQSSVIKVNSLNSVVTIVETPGGRTPENPAGVLQAVTNCGAGELCATQVLPQLKLGMQSWREIN